jgi:Domain of unknown function (DUF4342)
MDIPHVFEDIKVQAAELGDKVKELLHEGNVRRIIIKDSHGHTFMEIPLTIAAVGAIAAPVLTAIGALAAMVADFHLVVERSEATAPPPPNPPPPAA